MAAQKDTPVKPPEPKASAVAAAAPAAPPSTAKRLLLGLAIVLIALLAAYGFGRLQGARAGKEAEQRAKTSLDKTSGLESALASKQAELLRLEARRKLHLALVALDDRNFGIAQQNVSAAGRLLTKSAATGELGTLASELSTTTLVATEDVGAQRARVLGWARRMDAALPTIEP